jgi:hypothetical protein
MIAFYVGIVVVVTVVLTGIAVYLLNKLNRS